MCKAKVTAKVVEEQNYNTDHIILINACSVSE